MKKNIWTIGHSNHRMEDFLLLLQSFEIKVLVDIRRFPGSKKFPHFNKEELSSTLKKHNIEYLHYKELGGRRKPRPDSLNDRWENSAFRGYADYMETEEFKRSLTSLKEAAEAQATAMMCSEAKWWQCHRALVSDVLKWEGWSVFHIMGKGKAKEHPYSPGARQIQGHLDYSKSSDELRTTTDE